MSEAVATSQQELVGKYKPYPEYKDSGVEWLGNVPEHWVLTRVKDVAVVFGGYPFDSRRFSPDVGVPLIRIRDINTELTAVYFDGDVPKEAIIENNDVLIGMDGEFNVARWKGGKAALNQRVACVRTDSDELTTLLYYMLPFNLKVVNDLTYYTTVKHLSLEDIKKTIFALPQGEELSNIVAYLDHETARIDRLIAQQQRLIELLKEKRQAVISHAVTKGLNPNAPMKDSDIEWLGQVPEHWIISQPRYLCHFVGGGTPSKDNPFFWDGNIPWVSPKDMKQDFINDSIDKISEHAISESSVKLIAPDAVLMVVRGMILAHSVPVALTTAPVTINQDMKAMIVDSQKLNGEYWLRLLQGIKNIILDLTESSAHGTKCLRSEAFDKLSVPIPPLDEQIQILKYMNSTLAHIDKLLLKATNLIGFAEERRSALISAAVTGKIDLRGWTHLDEEVAA